MKKFLNHPILIFIGLISSIIGIFVFFSGKSDINKFFSSKDKTDSSNAPKVDSQILKYYEDHVIDSALKVVRETSRLIDSSIKQFEKSKPYCDYLNMHIGFLAVAPKGYTVSKGEDDDDEKCNLLKLSTRIKSNDIPVFILSTNRDTVNIDGQKAFLHGFFNHFLMPQEKENSLLFDKKFQPSIIDNNKFWFNSTERNYGEVLVKQQMYVGFVKNHFVTIMVNVFTQQQLDDCLKLINSITFNSD